MLLSAVLLLQSVIAGACAAHDAAHGRVAAADASGPAMAPESAHTASESTALGPGETELLHAILHAAHCGGCAHGMGAKALELRVSACISATAPAIHAGRETNTYCPDPSLRPPIAA